MSQSNEFSLGISINKPHLRKAGEEEWWEKTMESYISTNDYQCWRVILNGNGVVDLNKPEADWTPADYTTMEKNAKARQYILNGLGREDMDKVLHIDNAKGMWNALKEMHEGSDELKASRKFQLQGEYHSFKMNDNESVSEYYSRFQRLTSKLTNAGVVLEDTSKALVIVNGLTEKFSLIKGIMRNTPGALALALPQIIGKLVVDETELKKANQTKEVEKGVALKIQAGISKAFARLETEENSSDDEEEEEDEMTALFTKHIKKQFIKRKFKPNFQKKDLKEYVCYQCNKKGHFAKNCPNGSGEEKQENKVSQENTFSRNKFQKKKALVAAWGSDSEEESGSPKGDRCLMARSSAGSATSEVASNDLSNSLSD